MGRRSALRGVLIATILAISTLASGCESSNSAGESASGTESDGVAATEVASQYGYDIESATQTPAFALVPEYKDPRDLYARILLAQQCLEGILQYQVMPPPPDTSSTVFDPRSGDRRFNEEIAAQWAYQVPPPSPPTTTELSSGLSESEIDERRLACGEATNDRLGLPPEIVLNDIVAAGWGAFAVSDEVDSAAGEWRTCMAPAGVIDLPAGPNDMPSPSVASQGSGSDGSSGVPSAREREVAIQDAQCREATGFAAAALNARAEGELVAIGRDIEGFESTRLAYREYSAGIDQVIEELG